MAETPPPPAVATTPSLVLPHFLGGPDISHLFSAVMTKLWERERHDLTQMTEPSKRQDVLHRCWNDRAPGLDLETFKKGDPLWNVPYRLWSSRYLNASDRWVLHVWATNNHIQSKTYYESQQPQPQDGDMVMMFAIRATAEEWTLFEEDRLSVQ